jgi:hypothetical protein
MPPGPPPKRSEERRRRNKDTVEVLKVNLDETIAGDVEIPAPPVVYEKVDKDTGEITVLDEPKHLWHPAAESLYLSLARSGQAIFYEPSDWAQAYATCEALSRELSPKPVVLTDSEGGTYVEMHIQPVNGAVFNACLKSLGSLMVSEGDRRRLRIELDRQKRIDAALGEDGVVVDIVKHRADLFSKASRG